MTHYRLGIDTGGTFTDLIGFDLDTGQLQSAKVPSTPREPLQAFIGVIREFGAGSEEVAGLVHGTTVATNTLIQRKGAKVAFVTTAGFEDMPYIQRVNRQELYNIDWDKPRPLLRSRRHCFGLNERVDPRGQVVRPLDLAEVDALCDRLLADEFEAVAICLLFAYVNTDHEQAVVERLSQRLGSMPLSVSHEVAPIWREYERASTTIADAYLKPLIQHYVGSLQRGLDDASIKTAWALMKSNGGIMQAAAAAEHPIELAMSGPAGGMVASKWLAELTGFRNVVTIDVGGTSADVGIIVDGQLNHTTEYEIEWGIPASIPIIDLKTIGAGGGSIAWVNAGGFLQVGPQSAGAEPGPICYGLGGSEPTLTDANLILGRLDPAFFLGGKMHLYPEPARDCMARMAEQIGMDTIQLAHSIIEIANENMANAIRMVSVERGHDPRHFGLVAFGGAGPLHGASIARKLEIPRVIVPPYPGAFSALGLLMADLRVDKVWTKAFRSDRASADLVRTQFERIAGTALAELRQQGYAGEPEFHYFINMRYLGQNYETEVDLTSALGSEAVLDRAYEVFHRLHETMYGYSIPSAVIELISFKVTVVGKIPKPELTSARCAGPEPYRERRVHFYGHGEVPCRLIRRQCLPIGERIPGPVIVEEEMSTLLVEPGMHVTRNEYDVLIVEV